MSRNNTKGTDMKKFFITALLFLGVAGYPLLHSAFAGGELPEPDTSGAGEFCVESRDFMRANHMVLLHQWRDEVVRQNQRTYTNSQGVHFEKSLSKTCLGCHKSNENFCESCHSSAGVDTYCFDCHSSQNLETGLSPHEGDIHE